MSQSNAIQIPGGLAVEKPECAPMIENAMMAARTAQIKWSRTTVAHRLNLVRKLRQLIAENASQLAQSSATARNRPTLESLAAEVLPLAEACRFLEREAEKILAPQHFGKRNRPLWLTGMGSEIHREPFGVILVIGPGNYPLLLPGVQVIQALVAGNAVVLKPGVGGANVAQLLCELIVRAGFDEQLVSLLPETAEAARTAIAARPDKVVFTGSAVTGEKILAQLAPQLIPATMELSGCDAVIIRADADLDLVVKALVFGVTLNGGATCLAPKRVFIARSLATELEGRLARAFPISSQRELEPANHKELLLLLNDAIARSAHFVAGSIGDKGELHTPIVLGGVSSSSHLLNEDVFAPVISIITVANDDEAVTQVNNCPYGLGASIFSCDEPAARSLAAKITAGVISINDLILPTADARLPFGGRGRSGFGSTRGPDGLLELTTPKVVTVTCGNFRPALEPPQSGDEKLFEAYLKLTHGHGWKSRGRALVSFIKILTRRGKSSMKKKL